MTRTLRTSALASALLLACGDDGTRPDPTQTAADTTSPGTTDDPTSTPPTTGTETSATPPTSSDSDSDSDTGTITGSTTVTTDATGPVTATTTDATTDATTVGEEPCSGCDDPNQQCILGQCVTSCQGQDPDPCGPAEVCDVITGDCKDPADACLLAGPSLACGANSCGPGTVCDGAGACLPIAPCVDVACTADGDCWGALCGCDRPKPCDDPDLALLNGPFSTEITALDFADDCTAWMVTLRSGTDYLRRLQPDGTLTEWPGVSNLDMGEVKVLRSLTIPQLTIPFPLADRPQPPTPTPIEGLGEVALTYTCCANCGCAVDPPQGVARLVEEDPVTPLPLVIVAKVTQGTGPFGEVVADAGPQGLTWGVDRVLYVG